MGMTHCTCYTKKICLHCYKKYCGNCYLEKYTTKDHRLVHKSTCCRGNINLDGSCICQKCKRWSTCDYRKDFNTCCRHCYPTQPDDRRNHEKHSNSLLYMF
jgi:hypothetical protein